MTRLFFLFFLISLIYNPFFGAGQELPKLSPFSGLPLGAEESRRPVVVTVENASPARPQAGLEYAELVYEFLVEGGITRFLALYYGDYPKKVGPIRSARPYLLEMASEFDPLYLHVGGSQEAYMLLRELKIHNLDELGPDRIYFFRISNRSPPYNLYTDLSLLKHLIEEGGSYDIPSWFSFGPSSSKGDQGEISINYWGGYTVSYTYLGEEGRYLRYLNGRPHLTEGGVHLGAHNLLIFFTPTRVLDEAGRLTMELQGKGPLLFFRDGFTIEGHWIKEEERTYYVDKEGAELIFSPGQTWINVVPMSTSINY